MQAELNNSVVIDGLLFDIETGECLGVWEKPAFHVTDTEKAEWLMRKLWDYDADILALEAREKAILENIGKMKADVKQRRDGLAYRFGPELEQFAKENLPQGKKTWACPFGSVSFRASHGGVRVVDEKSALEIAQKSGWANAIKVTEEFRVSQLTPLQADTVKAWLTESDPSQDIVGNAFKIVEPQDLATIKTGVKPQDKND